MKKTYEEMARELDIRWCPGTVIGYPCPMEHRLNGSVTHDRGPDAPGTVHWREASSNPADQLAFLKLAAMALDPTLADEATPWRRVYRLCMLARATGARLHIKVPARLWAGDKAFVLAGVAGLPNDVPQRKQAFDWARR
jgi:hypothetical protein